MALAVKELPYHPDTAARFGVLAGQPWSAWLDSGHPWAGGRWDILVCAPRRTLVTRGLYTEIREGSRCLRSREDPLKLLQESLGPQQPSHPPFPFLGGGLGWLAYDLGRRFERLPCTARDRQHLPEMAVGIYDWALLVDHEQQQTWLVGQAERSPAARDQLLRIAQRPVPARVGQFRVWGPVQSNLSGADYADRFQQIQAYIRAGDCYQVNLTRRFSVRAQGDPWVVYLALRQRNPAPFAGFLHTPPLCLLSASPERFLRVRDGRVDTWPIKGTRPRSQDPVQDRALREQLANSPKDLAENLMILDLLRNDLGRTCAIGSVRVPQCFAVQSFADVHHLVSQVCGRLRPDQHPLDVLRGCFPGGSITGAPKIRAMEIIEDLEGERRSLYCGSLGYWGFDGSMDTNILIRTLVYARGQLSYWAGGGIVADSDCAEEAAELALKARALGEVVEGFRQDPARSSGTGALPGRSS